MAHGSHSTLVIFHSRVLFWKYGFKVVESWKALQSSTRP